MTDLAPTPVFMPAQPYGAADACDVCHNAHDTKLHPVLEVLNRQTELLAVLAGVLEPRRYPMSMDTYEDGSGKATAIFESWPGGVSKLWLVERTVTYTNSTGSPTMGVYVVDSIPSLTYGALNQPVVPILSPRDLRNYTNLVIAADDNPSAPVLVHGGQKLVFQWTTLSAGARCVANVQIRQCWQSVD